MSEPQFPPFFLTKTRRTLGFVPDSMSRSFHSTKPLYRSPSNSVRKLERGSRAEPNQATSEDLLYISHFSQLCLLSPRPTMIVAASGESPPRCCRSRYEKLLQKGSNRSIHQPNGGEGSKSREPLCEKVFSNIFLTKSMHAHNVEASPRRMP